MKNIVLIVVDTLRPDRLGCYGYGRPTSPRLDALAAEGILLENLWSASNFTAPAFTSLFTGLHPHEHRVFDFTAKVGGSPIADALRGAGVRTGGVVTFRFFRNLLENVWGEIEAVTDTRSFDYAKDLPMQVTAGGIEWLHRHGGEGPFALFLHYDGPHMPYRLPDDFAAAFDTVAEDAVAADVRGVLFPQEHERIAVGDDARTSPMFRLLEDIDWGRRRLDAPTLAWIRDKYDASVRYNDEAVGRFLDALAAAGRADDTVVCVLSDHGEAFLEHGSIAHGGIHLYEEVIRTVGLIRDPGGRAPAGRRVARPLGHVGVLPTLLALAGVPGAGTVAEGSFAGVLADPAAAPAAPVFCQGKGKIAVRSGRHKLIRTRPNPALTRMQRLRILAKMILRRDVRDEVFDLEADPAERVNLAGDRALKRSLGDLVKGHLATVRDAGRPAAPTDEETRRRIEKELEDLGYM